MNTTAGFPGLLLAVALVVASGTMPAVDAMAQDDAAEQPVTAEPSATDEQPAADEPSVTKEQSTTEEQSATEEPATTEQEASTQDPSVMEEDSTADEQSIIVAKPKPVVDRSVPPVVSVVQVPRAAISTRGVVLPKILGSYR